MKLNDEKHEVVKSPVYIFWIAYEYSAALLRLRHCSMEIKLS